MKKHRKFLEDLQTSEQFYDDKESRQIIGELMALIDDGLNKQPKADWIPCEERLPDVEKKVLVTLWCHSTEQGFLSRKGKWFVIADDGINEATVLAWQPLPQPYKADHLGEVNGMVTNADRIRNMTDEELAKLFSNTTMCLAVLGEVDCSDEKNCNNCKEVIRKWLQAEVKEGAE